MYQDPEERQADREAERLSLDDKVSLPEPGEPTLS
jgi:hypothetical protein